jgi:hypothetical protein
LNEIGRRAVLQTLLTGLGFNFFKLN